MGKPKGEKTWVPSILRWPRVLILATRVFQEHFFKWSRSSDKSTRKTHECAQRRSLTLKRRSEVISKKIRYQRKIRNTSKRNSFLFRATRKENSPTLTLNSADLFTRFNLHKISKLAKTDRLSRIRVSVLVVVRILNHPTSVEASQIWWGVQVYSNNSRISRSLERMTLALKEWMWQIQTKSY